MGVPKSEHVVGFSSCFDLDEPVRLICLISLGAMLPSFDADTIRDDVFACDRGLGIKLSTYVQTISFHLQISLLLATNLGRSEEY